jgi:polyhydroxyalkanoate synthase subunit PhaC
MEQYNAQLENWFNSLLQATPLVVATSHIAVGQTPKEIIWTKNKAKLYHYLPLKGTFRHPVPLLLVYGLINQPYILDLKPETSLVRFLLERGYEVYLLDWGNAGIEDRHMSLDDYIAGYLPKAVKQVLRHAHAGQLSLFGYCMGATFAACYTALQPETVKNLVLVAAPIDFSEPTLYHLWLDPHYFDLDLIVDSYGLIPPEMIDFGNKLLKPYTNFFANYQTFWKNICNPEATEAWLTLHQWVHDGVNFPGVAFKQWVRDLYQGNKLAKSELYLHGQKVDLSRINASLLNIIADRDHITVPSQSRAIMRLVSSLDREQQVFPAGHVGLVISRSTATLFYQALDDWLRGRMN